MENKELIKKSMLKLEEENSCKVIEGGIDWYSVNKLSKKNLLRLIDGIESGYETQSIKLVLNKKHCVAEVGIVDMDNDVYELDISFLYKLEYVNKYGDEILYDSYGNKEKWID